MRSRRPSLLAGLSVVVPLSLAAAGCSSSATTAPPARPVAAHPAARSAGCAKPAPPATNEERDYLTVDGVQRWYLITTPPAGGSAQPMPVVLDLHGLGEGASLHATTTSFGALATSDHFVAVFPNGTGSPVRWDSDPRAAPNPDLDFLSALIDHLESTLCVNRSRIYATGLSDGAIMDSLLMCKMANRIAAFAPVSGIELPKPCRPGRPVPILAFHGTADPILYFNGGIGTDVLNHALAGGPAPPPTTIPPPNLHGSGYPATVQAWAVKDGCDPRPTDTQMSPHVIHRTYRCPAGGDVEFYIVVGGGHAWPGSRFSQSIANITGPTTFEINATDTIWRFFQRFQLPA